MRFTFWPGAAHTWDETLARIRHVESTGWDRIYYADHFMPASPEAEGPWNECWVTLAALAAAVPRIEIGALVSGNTYRHPAVLAKMAATLDHVSGGRAVLGLGAGWQENEHRAYGIPYYTLGERLARLGEACELIRALLHQDRTDFAGKYYQLQNAPLQPKPPHPVPLLVGGGGERVTLRIAARFADEWNVWGDPETLRKKIEILEGHCREVGRPPEAIERSAVALLFLSDDEPYLEKMRSARGGFPRIVGTPAQVRETLEAYAAAGVNEVVIPDFNLGPRAQALPVLDRFIREVAPALR